MLRELSRFLRSQPSDDSGLRFNVKVTANFRSCPWILMDVDGNKKPASPYGMWV